MVAMRQGDFCIVCTNLVLPLVNEQVVIYPQAHAIVSKNGEAVSASVK
jgi:hypothetical protein